MFFGAYRNHARLTTPALAGGVREDGMDRTVARQRETLW